MPLELGGRADKAGNRYEIRCIIYELLKVIREMNYSVVIEALGDDEQGTDILVTNFDGVKEHQQCKARNGSKEYWSVTDLKSKNIVRNWKVQLDRDENRNVALISPIGCSYMVDLHDRALNTSGNPQDFYEYQIQNNSKSFCAFYEDLCSGMDLNPEENIDVEKSIYYIKRINFKQISEILLKEIVMQQIEFIFCTNKDIVYDSLVAFIVEGNILGKEITAGLLIEYFERHNLVMRLLNGDKRIIPLIKSVNEEYRKSFKSLKEGFIERPEFQKCINLLKKEQSFIISGNAGYGKSGCTEAILNYCEKENIPYIALKLDRKIPRGNCEAWGHELGFSSSISYSLHAVSKDRPAVIILDQLDALRWTQANSTEAVAVCMELIHQVKYINLERDKKIVIVFVCREFDLCNDNNIKNLFENDDNINQNIWEKIIVKEFSEETVRKVVGEQFEQLTTKTKRLLQIPSNLYIWQHLDGNSTYDDCITTSHLIDTWFEQVCKKSYSVGVLEKNVRETLNSIVTKLDKMGRLYIPKMILDVDISALNYLIYSELLTLDETRIGFVHQSILDYFISKKMMRQFYNGESIELIVGDKKKQSPNRRYQIQMFMQNLLEYNSADFLNAGNEMITSAKIRFYVKYVFYEILRQISEPDMKVAEYIKKVCEDDIKRNYFLDNVVFGKPVYVTILRQAGIVEKWWLDEEKRENVFKLYKSISPDLSSEDVEFIRKYSFICEEYDKEFMDCFSHDITQESYELFELRMQFCNKYPAWEQNMYVDIRSMMENCEDRTIRLLAFWLENKIKSKGTSVYRYEEEIINDNTEYLIQNGKYVLDKLLQYLPKEDISKIYFSEWSATFLHKRGLERAAVELIKKANKVIIQTNCELFWEYYEPYMGKNYVVFNEIILHGFQYFPTSYSNQIITYLSSDFDMKVFDYTSGNQEELKLVADVLKIHISFCSKDVLKRFLDSVVCYISPKAVEWYKDRLDFNRAKQSAPVYWSFWGDFQYYLFSNIPYEILPQKYKDLLNVLERKFKGKAKRYINGDGHSGWVKSPVSGKKIGIKQWLRIITNKKLTYHRNSNWKEVDGGFIESSIEMYSGDFQSAVKDEPQKMVEAVLEHKNDVIPIFINSIYSGIALSEKINQVNQELLEQMFNAFPCSDDTSRFKYFCDIIANAKIYTWSSDVIDLLKDIVLNYEEDRDTIQLQNTGLNSSELISKSLNCVRGRGLIAVGQLLWNNQELFCEFKSVIDILVLDKDPAVRMAVLHVLWPVYNIDREYAETRILQIYESDVRMASFQDSKDMFFRLYEKYKERILDVIGKCFDTNDDRLIEMGGASICEFFIRNNEFVETMATIEQQDEKQIKAILHMAVLYLKFDEYRETSKKIILKIKNSNDDMELPLSSMFFNNLVDVERDAEFLICIMKAKVSRRITYSFIHFLEDNARSVKAYASVIIALCENILNTLPEDIELRWGIASDISKLIMALYDETANSDVEIDKCVAEKCLELWDIMFEKQIGQVQYLSKQLMER